MKHHRLRDLLTPARFIRPPGDHRYLEDNNLTALPEGIFQNLTALRAL